MDPEDELKKIGDTISLLVNHCLNKISLVQ